MPNEQVTINLHHERQDIQGTRTFDANRHRYRFALNLIPNAQPGERLADVGGGAGEFVELLRRKGYQTLLIDGNAISVEREQQRGFQSIHVDLNKGIDGVGDGSVDGAVCLEVIEHIVPAEHLLQEIHRIVKPGGFVILSTPNFSYILDRIAYAMGADAKEEGYHFRFYTKRKIRGMIQAAGFRVIETQTFGGLIGINFILKCMTFGRVRVPPVAIPESLESFLGRTFVYKLERLPQKSAT